MIVSRTPLRVSFFGGGTDYPEYFRRARGAVLGMAIDKYVYIATLSLSSVLDYRYRLSYSKIETVNTVAEIQHPVVRSVIELTPIESPLAYMNVPSKRYSRTKRGAFTSGKNPLNVRSTAPWLP